MRYIFLTLSLFLVNTVFSQNYEWIDNKVKKYPNFSNIEVLLLRVSNDFNTDEEKVRAYYTWISHNISYDLNRYYSFSPPEMQITFDSERLNKSIQRQKNEKLIQKTLTSKKAICLGFSTLFNELCLRSGIDSQIIKGITKLSTNEINSTRNIKNHAWNAVKINDKWQLVDVTWSNGYENMNTRSWTKRFNDFYFFTNPNEFLNSHLPENPVLQFVTHPINIKSFFETPIFYSKYFESGVRVANNQKGLIELKEKNNTIRIVFKEKANTSKIYYKFKNKKHSKELNLIKKDNNLYVASLKYRSNTSNILSLYYENEKILDFKIEK
ncbi:transglutaminase domain-containing protein [uncultured Psychroserpens sp.]|uniref:transglutaminase domain-containing protein n=1 Tax=uncultured Psychroserpens sp. TaxID=255436 RepID=UPI00263486A3|nr:transglutaminase domain-containing protein [uncultured Psychroserpens sp.]